MPIDTWKLEFYPTPASVARHLGANGVEGPFMRRPADAVRHCLRKWEGLTTENLCKHGLWAGGSSLYAVENVFADYPLFHLGGSSCALCQMSSRSGSNPCNRCPITVSRGTPCDDEWEHFVICDDPQPMLDLLQSTLEYLTKE